MASHAVAGGFGSIKPEEFNKFLDSLYQEKKPDIDEAFNRMKEMGLPVEG